jgi:hypothetical protein
LLSLLSPTAIAAAVLFVDTARWSSSNSIGLKGVGAASSSMLSIIVAAVLVSSDSAIVAVLGGSDADDGAARPSSISLSFLLRRGLYDTLVIACFYLLKWGKKI